MLNPYTYCFNRSYITYQFSIDLSFRKQLLKLCSFIYFLISFFCLESVSLEKKNCWNHIDFKKTEKSLSEVRIKKITPFYSYYARYKKNFPTWNYKIFMERHKKKPIFILTLNNALKAIFKPKSKERLIEAIQSSVIAYNFSRALGLRLVPPTVIRKIQGKIGSVQLFIDNTIMGVHDIQSIEKLKPVQKGNIYIFYFVAGVFDVNYLNILISKNCSKPVIVDNDSMLKIALIPYGKHPFVLYPIKWEYFPLMSVKSFEAVPFEKSFSVFNPSWNLLKRHFSGLNDLQIKSLQTDFLKRGKHQKKKYFSYFRYRGGYWIGSEEIFSLEGVYKHLLPLNNKKFFSEKTVQALKKLNYRSLRKLFPKKSRFKIYDSKVYGILHRRNVILREYKKLIHEIE